MSKYEKFSKEELMALVEKQDGELATKKYGLVWDSERELEQVVLDCENNLPVLKRVKNKEIRTNDKEDNILIEGDNYHALTVLNYTHQEKIDVIYIDPPYNTGNQDFKYNDKFIDKEDGFRHSKWLNFMEKRLNLAKDLLKETGVIFISIDDNEMAQLKILCDKILGEENFINCIVIKTKASSGASGGGEDKGLKKNKEYLLVYSKDSVCLNIQKQYIKVNLSEYIQERRTKDVGFYYTRILVDEGKKKLIGEKKGMKIYDHKNFIFETVNDIIKKQKISEDEVYSKYFDKIFMVTNAQTSLLKKVIDVANGGKQKLLSYVYKPSSGKFKGGEVEKYIWNDTLVVWLKDSAEKQNDTIFKKVELGDLWSDISWGRLDLEGDVTFKNGKKPVALIKRLMSMNNNNATILDFMAGSGTTGHAVLELNKEDGGNRKFILCTNNELNGFEKELREKGLSEKEIEKYGICQRVTYPRLEKVIKGYKKNGDGEKVEGLGGNLQYFRTALVKKTTTVNTKLDITCKCTEMLCVKENIFNLEKEAEDYKIFSSNKKDKFLCIYYNFIEKSFDDFLSEVKKIKEEKAIYIFSLKDEIDKKITSSVENARFEAIPHKILKVYEEWVKKNIPMRSDLILLEFERAKDKLFEQKDKDESARLLRIVLEKIIIKISQKNNVEFLKENAKQEKASILNDKLKSENIFSKVDWEENKTYLAIGNNVSHGDYGDYNIKQVENFYRHIQMLLNKFGI